MYKLNITRFTPLAVGCALFLGAAQSAMAQSTASANANGGAQIVTAITISKNQDLLFGQIVSDPTGGTVTVTPAGVRTASENTLRSLSPECPAIYTLSPSPRSILRILSRLPLALGARVSP